MLFKLLKDMLCVLQLPKYLGPMKYFLNNTIVLKTRFILYIYIYTHINTYIYICTSCNFTMNEPIYCKYCCCLMIYHHTHSGKQEYGMYTFLQLVYTTSRLLFPRAWVDTQRNIRLIIYIGNVPSNMGEISIPFPFDKTKMLVMWSNTNISSILWWILCRYMRHWTK